MCVILIADTAKPSDTLLEQAGTRNPDGAGVAWREDGYVCWKKGIELEEVSLLCDELPLPFIVHFRIGTVGGKRLELCHPFPIEPNVSLALEGKTKETVLFHNGTWHAWRGSLLESIVKLSVKVPVGKWSDSRAMAWAAAQYGTGYLDIIEEKCAILGPNELDIFGVGWSVAEEGVLASNKNYEAVFHDRAHGYGINLGNTSTMCRERTCTSKEHLDEYGYCPLHSFISRTKGMAIALVEKRLPVPETHTEATEVSALVDSHPGMGQETPFMKVLRMFKEGKLTKKEFKRAKRVIDEKALAALPLY